MMPPYHPLEKPTRTYKSIGEKSYNNTTFGDIVRIETPFVPGIGSIIEPGEMFKYIERLNASLWRVKRISTGKTYKVFASKFITPGSSIYVTIWKGFDGDCIWNKAK